MHNVELDVISTIIFGATILAFIYHAILFFFSKDKFLIHYLIYLFFTGIFVSATSGLVAAVFGEYTEDFIQYYFRETIQIVYLTSYFSFIIEAIGLSDKKKFLLFRYWILIAGILLSYAIAHPLAKHFFPTADFTIPFTVIRLFIFGITAIMLYQSYKLREIKFQLIILYGCTIYFLIGLLSFTLNLPLFFGRSIIYPLEWLMLGSFIDIIFFSVAIAYRNRKEYEKLNLSLLEEANKLLALQDEVMEKQRELENERARIAADMHDDLGSGLTKITYLSQLALKQSDNNEALSKIKQTASELVGNMSELIWVMKEENNTLEDLATYIKSYAVDYLDNNNISLRMKIPDSLSDITISGNQRRNLFLSVKECLHNVVKHSGADSVFIEITVNGQLKLSIHDNGKGISGKNEPAPLHGNGLKNMMSRIENMKGNMLLTNDNGTNVCFSIPLNR